MLLNSCSTFFNVVLPCRRDKTVVLLLHHLLMCTVSKITRTTHAMFRMRSAKDTVHCLSGEIWKCSPGPGQKLWLEDKVICTPFLLA